MLTPCLIGSCQWFSLTLELVLYSGDCFTCCAEVHQSMLSLSICVCLSVCLCVSVVCMWLCKSVWIWMHVCEYMYIWVFMSDSVCVVCVWLCECVLVSEYMSACACMCVCSMYDCNWVSMWEYVYEHMYVYESICVWVCSVCAIRIFFYFLEYFSGNSCLCLFLYSEGLP